MKDAHLGTRRQTYIRKNDEDKDLPKYIRSYRLSGILKSYVITKFPIGIDKCEYFKDVYFSISKYGDKHNALTKAIEFLNELKEKYTHINNEIFKEKSIIKPVISLKEKKENKLIDKLPEYIYPILEDNKIKGYYVDGIVNCEGNFYPKRIFNNNTNRWNLDQSIKFVNMLKYINDNNVNMKGFFIDEIDIMDVSEAFYEKYYLPKYFNIFRKNGEIIGFCINGYPSDKHVGGKYKKEFRMKTMKGLKTLDEAYSDGIEYLYDLKNGYITV